MGNLIGSEASRSPDPQSSLRNGDIIGMGQWPQPLICRELQDDPRQGRIDQSPSGPLLS